jgi:hypothetical protein
LVLAAFAVGGDGEEGGEHGEGDVAVPGLVAADLVVIETGLVLGELEGFSTPQRDPATRTSSATGTGWGLRQM